MGQKGEDAAGAEEDGARALYLNKCVGGGWAGYLARRLPRPTVMYMQGSVGVVSG